MHRVLVLGAGKIGALISGLLAESGDYRVQLADSRANAAAEVVAAHGLENLRAFELDAADEESLTEHLRAHPAEALVSGLPYFCNPPVARVARAEGLHYFDLTEDVAVTETVRQLAQGNERTRQLQRQFELFQDVTHIQRDAGGQQKGQRRHGQPFGRSAGGCEAGRPDRG